MLRRFARPLVSRARRAKRSLDYRLRPLKVWNGEHDPVLSHFPPWSGEADGRFAYDFLGIRTDPAFRVQYSADPPGPLHTDYPPPSPTYFEFIAVLEAAVDGASESRRPFTMVELGAGHGHWLVAVHRALGRLSTRPTQLIGVEMEGTHYQWMRGHLANNGIDPDAHLVLRAAVGAVDGRAEYRVDPRPDAEYGLRVTAALEDGSSFDALVDEARLATPSIQHGVASVPCLRLRSLLATVPRVDLMHLDVQGAEADALEDAATELHRVDRIVVATHSRRLHRRVRETFSGVGWTLLQELPFRRRVSTELGDIETLDGLQVWVNPRTSG